MNMEEARKIVEETLKKQNLTDIQSAEVCASLSRNAGVILARLIEKISEDYIQQENPPLNWIKDTLEEYLPQFFSFIILRSIQGPAAMLDPYSPAFLLLASVVQSTIMGYYNKTLSVQHGS